MARARSIKPGFFKNESLAELSPAARLLFAGLWTLADREGRLEDRPKRIKAEIFPYDKENVDKLLSDLHEAGFIRRYSELGGNYIHLPTFHKHQNPHYKEAPSIIPPPSGVSDKYPHETVTSEQRLRILKRDENKCVLCGATESLQVDHIKPRAQGGTSQDDNLRSLCASCNNGRPKRNNTSIIEQASPGHTKSSRALTLNPVTCNLNPEPCNLNPEPLTRKEQTLASDTPVIEIEKHYLTGEEYELWTDERCAAFLKSIKWKPSNVSQAQVDQILEIEPLCLKHSSDGPGALVRIQSQLTQFELFLWPKCWRKVDKKAAREAFLKVLAADETGDLMCDVMDGVERQRTKMLAKEEQFRPHIATWLNHGRWGDQPGEMIAD